MASAGFGARFQRWNGCCAGVHPQCGLRVLIFRRAIEYENQLVGTVAAQRGTGNEVSASALKQQLLEIESKETQIRLRLEELDEQLKPESIERELAGIGSLHPEELRAHRRKLLKIERKGLQTQLDLLEEERARVEAAITTAEANCSLIACYVLNRFACLVARDTLDVRSTTKHKFGGDYEQTQTTNGMAQHATHIVIRSSSASRIRAGAKT